MQIVHSTHPDDADRLTNDELRQRFVVGDLFQPGRVQLTLSHDDRMIIGGALPVGEPLALLAPEQLRAETFCERREVAIVALDDGGRVSADGQEYALDAHDILYVGRGTTSVTLAGDSVRFYLVSSLASAHHPTTLARKEDAEALHLGEAEGANVRDLRRYIHADGVASDRLVVGITTLAPGSVWNTMPPHLHDRRTEVYLYTGLGPQDRVLHLCGRPERTRTLMMADAEAVISPPWSIHSGVGTAAYSFIWAMAGENQAFTDMDALSAQDLR